MKKKNERCPNRLNRLVRSSSETPNLLPLPCGVERRVGVYAAGKPNDQDELPERR